MSDKTLELWNRCDVCGKFIALHDFPERATRRCVAPDSEFTRETWETLCVSHSTVKGGECVGEEA